MDDLERRVAGTFDRLPEPDAVVTDRARARALGALPGRRRVRRLAAFTAVAVAAAVGGAAIAAVGGLSLRDDDHDTPTLAEGTVALPDGLAGVAIAVDGRVWSRTRDGFAIEGLHAETVELSPNARNLAVGIGSSLVALTPRGRTAWKHAADGPVVAAAWAPNPQPIYVAYLVRLGSRHDLHVIEGDGDNDRLVARDVGATPPVWNRTPLEVWYVDPRGVWRTYAPATGRRAVTKPVGPDDDGVDLLVTQRARQAAGRSDWIARTAADVGTDGTLVALSSPDSAPTRQTEVWWLPDGGGSSALVLRTGSPGTSVALTGRP